MIGKTNNLPLVLTRLRAGRPILLHDDGAANGPVYLAFPAAEISAADICVMVNSGRGVICAALDEDRFATLGLPLMNPSSSGAGALEFSVSVEARKGVTTGISASDRAATLRTVALTQDPKLDLVMPGHIFPVRAKRGGVLVRVAPPEALVDLLKLAGVTPVAAFCHCLNESGALIALEQAEELSVKLEAPLLSVSQVIHERLKQEQVVERVADTRLPTKKGGEFNAVCFRSRHDGAEHVALIKGDLSEKDHSGKQIPVLVRVHAENRLADLIGLSSGGSRPLIDAALDEISKAGRGVFVYVRHPRSNMLKREAEALAERTASDRPAPSRVREYGIGSQILSQLGVRRIRLLSKSHWEIPAVAAFGLEIAEQVQFPQVPSQAEGR